MATFEKSWRDEWGIGRVEGRKEEEMLGNYRLLRFRSTRKILRLINKLFVSAQEITDNVNLSRENYVRLIQFAFIKA